MSAEMSAAPFLSAHPGQPEEQQAATPVEQQQQQQQQAATPVEQQPVARRPWQRRVSATMAFNRVLNIKGEEESKRGCSLVLARSCWLARARLLIS